MPAERWEILPMIAGARGKGRPKLTETAEIDRAIRAAALHVLLEHGEAATMNAVALAAGISRKSLYARYPNKEELFLDVIRGMLKPADPVTFPNDGTAEERLVAFIRRALAGISQPESLAIQRLLRLNPAYISAVRPDMVAATQKILGVPLTQLLRDLADKGELLIDDLEATARAVISLILAEGLAGDGYIKPMSPETQLREAQFVTRFILHGLMPR
jgi:AcrR family transcriptional regulator